MSFFDVNLCQISCLNLYIAKCVRLPLLNLHLSSIEITLHGFVKKAYEDSLNNLDDVNDLEGMRKERVEALMAVAKGIWSRHSPLDLVAKVEGLWDSVSDDLGFKVEPMCNLPSTEGDNIKCVIMGSGSFSTGVDELQRAEELRPRIGFNPIEYVAVVTNRSKSNATKIAEQFDKPLICLDFEQWYRENVDLNSQNPIRETRFLYFQGDGDRLSIEEIRRRLRIRSEYGAELMKTVEEKIGFKPDTISLRGYSFPITVPISADDTHPADLSYVQPNTGRSLYPGWQAKGTAKMVADGHRIFRSSLIRAPPVNSIEDIEHVDAGELLSLTPGLQPTNEQDAKEIQEAMKRSEDSFLTTLKATGLLNYLWGIGVKPIRIRYRSLTGEVDVKGRPVIVGASVMSGKDAFGQTLEDLKMLDAI